MLAERQVDEIAKIEKLDDGLLTFYCPGCECRHWFNDRWLFNGNYERPTLSPSIVAMAKTSKRVCHSFVTDGNIQFLGDCTHSLAGQTVELPDIEDN